MNFWPYNLISIISLHDIFLLASSLVDNSQLTKKTSEYIDTAPAVKPETIDGWIKWLAKNHFEANSITNEPRRINECRIEE
jgi:hypothetical protein